MRRILGVIALGAGLWMAIGPWVVRASSSTSQVSGHMMGMKDQMQSTSQPIITASTYYWHLVPGGLAVLLAIGVVLFSGGSLLRWLAVALFVVGIWSAIGPWVLPRFGLGDMMTMGLTTSSFFLHVVGGGVLIACSAGIFVSAERTISESQRSVGLQQS